MKPKKNQKKDKHIISSRDCCQTPAHAIEPLLPLIPKDYAIWECACGAERLMENAFRLQEYIVHGTDLLYNQNFFTYYPEFDYDIIVTNPPWSIKYEWLQRCLELGKPFALLVPHETIAAKAYQNVCKLFGVCLDILAPERRINFKMPEKGWGKLEWDENKQKMVMKGESAQMPTCWVTHGLCAYREYDEISRIYPVKMRAVKYDDNNHPIERKHK